MKSRMKDEVSSFFEQAAPNPTFTILDAIKNFIFYLFPLPIIHSSLFRFYFISYSDSQNGGELFSLLLCQLHHQVQAQAQPIPVLYNTSQSFPMEYFNVNKKTWISFFLQLVEFFSVFSPWTVDGEEMFSIFSFL